MNDLLASFYEMLVGNTFADTMFNSGMYIEVFWISFFIVMPITLLYYIIIDSVRFSRWWHWLIVLGFSSLILFLVAYILPQDTFFVENISVPNSEFFLFGIENLLMGILLFIGFSALFRFTFSNNCRSTPFPQ